MNELRDIFFLITMGAMAMVFLLVFLVGCLAGALGTVLELASLLRASTSWFRWRKPIVILSGRN